MFEKQGITSRIVGVPELGRIGKRAISQVLVARRGQRVEGAWSACRFEGRQQERLQELEFDQVSGVLLDVGQNLGSIDETSELLGTEVLERANSLKDEVLGSVDHLEAADGRIVTRSVLTPGNLSHDFLDRSGVTPASTTPIALGKPETDYVESPQTGLLLWPLGR